MKDKGPGQKGTFGASRLGVAKAYVRPPEHGRALGLAAAAALALALGVIAASVVGGGERLVSNGPLASAHAAFESDCAVCHTRTGRLPDAACGACHEIFGRRYGIYGPVAHALYRGRDLGRVAATGKELPCRACHPDHLGREAAIVEAADGRCLRCHEFGSFARGHPQFDVLAEERPDADSLAFPHIHHLRQLARSEGIEEPEAACLRCHTPRPDGRGFAPVSFDAHCAACHLAPSIGTPALPIAGPADRYGVETLEVIRRRGGPGSSWTLEVNPAAFRVAPGGRLVKRPLTHRDPWVLENLRRIRRLGAPGPRLEALLGSTPDLPEGDPGALHAEAAATLADWAGELGSRPEPAVQDDLRRVRRELRLLERRLLDPATPLDPGAFAGPEAGPNLDRRWRELADALTEPCRRCHAVEEALVVRVQKDQRTLRRADFDHGAHVLQAGCLDCHDRIPMASPPAGSGPVDPAVDGAAIQNLPGIEVCRRCHAPGRASSRCVTCHRYHPEGEMPAAVEAVRRGAR